MPSPLFRSLRYGLASTALLIALPAAATPITVGNPNQIYQGIEFRPARVGVSRAFTVRVNLDTPGIGFTTTAPGGPKDTNDDCFANTL